MGSRLLAVVTGLFCVTASPLGTATQAQIVSSEAELISEDEKATLDGLGPSDLWESCACPCGGCRRRLFESACDDHRPWSPIGRLFDADRERVLPLLGSQARAAGYEIPLPFGVGANIAYMDQGMDIEQIRLGVAGGPPVALDDIPPFRIESRDTNISARYDVWILPLVNIYGVIGHTRGSAVGDVTVTGVPGLLPDTVLPVRIDYEGPTYGGGCTGAIGYENFFAVVDWNYTETNLEGIDSSITAQTVAPRVGLQSDGKAIWVGGFYTNVAKQLSSTVDVGGVPVRLLVDLDVATPWNFIYGVRWSPSPNLELVVEHGFGGRNQIIGAAAARF